MIRRHRMPHTMRAALRQGTRAAGMALAPMLAVAVHVPALAAQSSGGREAERPHWTFTQEAGAIVGATYFEGPRIASVTSTAGATIGVGLQRAIRPELSGRLVLRAGLSPINATEAGDSWSLGSLREVAATGMLSMDAKRWERAALRLEAGGGFAVVAGLGNTLPFSEVSALLPTFETGAALGRVPREGRRQWWLTARAGFMRMYPAPGGSLTGGWGTRYLVGVRTDR